MQGQKDREKKYTMHASRTFRYRNIRIMTSITAPLEDHDIWIQDIRQAYIQRYEFERELHINPAAKFQLSSDTYLKLPKPLYGLSESEDCWSQKYNDLLKKDLKLSATDGDPSFHYKTGEHDCKLHGTLALYVDDTLASGNHQFLKLTDKILEISNLNDQSFHRLSFLISLSTKKGSGYFLEQTQYAKDLDVLPKGSRTLRHKLASLANTNP